MVVGTYVFQVSIHFPTLEKVSPISCKNTPPYFKRGTTVVDYYHITPKMQTILVQYFVGHC